MFTSIDKAITAVVMAVLFFLNYFFGVDLNLPVDTINAIIAALTPILVYFVPNKSKAA